MVVWLLLIMVHQHYLNSITSIPYNYLGEMSEDIRNSNETLNSTSHRGSVRGGVIGYYTTVTGPLTPRSPTNESCESPYIKQRFGSVTDSDGSKSDIQQQAPHIRHYTYSFSPGPSGNTPTPLKFQYSDVSQWLRNLILSISTPSVSCCTLPPPSFLFLYWSLSL